MKLTATELVSVRAQGLYITDKGDGCRKLLNQTFRYTIAGEPEVYCSAGCRDLAFFGDTREAKKRSTPGKCVCCGATLERKRRGALNEGIVTRAQKLYREAGEIVAEEVKCRSQKHRLPWTRMHLLAARWIPQPRVLHPYPECRFAARYLR
jgi:hypothetical protein